MPYTIVAWKIRHLLQRTHSLIVTGLPPACCQDLELQLDDEELEVMISDADRSGRGEGITEEEYLHIMKNSIWI